jgi:hypothetical protein
MKTQTETTWDHQLSELREVKDFIMETLTVSERI